METTLKDTRQTPGYAWVILAVVFLASFTVPVNMFKAPVIFPVFMELYGFTPDTIGWMMSIFTIVSIVLAFPGAAIAKKFGTKNICLVATGSCVIGGLIGVFAPNAAVLLIGRVFEGVGMGFFGFLAPAALAEWFPANKFGLAVGIWGIWMPAGGVLMNNLAPALNSMGDWHTVWWFAIIFSAIAFVVFAILYKNPPKEFVEAAPQADTTGASTGKKPGIGSIVTMSIVLMGATFLIYNVCLNGTVNTFFPTFLQTEKGVDMATAGLITSLITMGNIICSIASGFISDKLGTRKWCIIPALLVLLVGTWLIFDWNDMTILWIGVLLAGLFPPFVSTCITAMAPEITPDKRNVPFTMAVVGFAANTGSFIGGIGLGYLVPVFGWSMGAHVLLVPLLLVAALCTYFIKVR
jgi:MFS family permease